MYLSFSQIRALVKGQLLLSVTSASGAAVDASGVQMQGVLDTTAAYEGPLGEWQEGKKRFVSGMQAYYGSKAV